MLIDLNKYYTDVFVRKFAFRMWFAFAYFINILGICLLYTSDAADE